MFGASRVGALLIAPGDEPALAVIVRALEGRGLADVPVYALGDRAALDGVGLTGVVDAGAETVDAFIARHLGSTERLLAIALGPFPALLQIAPELRPNVRVAVLSLEVIERTARVTTGLVRALNDEFAAVVVGHPTVTVQDAPAGRIGARFDRHLAAAPELAALLRGLCVQAARARIGVLGRLAARLDAGAGADAALAAVDDALDGARPPSTDGLYAVNAALARRLERNEAARAGVERYVQHTAAYVAGAVPRAGAAFASSLIDWRLAPGLVRLEYRAVPESPESVRALPSVKPAARDAARAPPCRVQFLAAPEHLDEHMCAAFFPFADPASE